MGGALRRRVAGCRLGRWRDSSLGRSRRTHESFRTPVFKFAMICCVSLRLVAIALRDARSIAPVFAPGCVWLRLVQGVRWQKYGSIGSHGPPHDQRSPRLPRRREASGSRGWRSWDEHGAQAKDQLRREVVLSPQTNYRGVQRKTSQSRRGSGPPTALSMGMPVLPDHSSSIGRRASPRISVARIAYVASPIRSHPSV